MPEFPGGDAGLLEFISKNTRYPEDAKTKGITGKVIVRFAVETDGSVDKVSVLKGVNPQLDAEAFRVVSSLPKFAKPGLIKDKPVAVWYMVPINFTLK
jgi:TonB family protein